ncbi:MAG: hypothetical protein WA988_18450 [Candidatus Nanopelagicales bacterium]
MEIVGVDPRDVEWEDDSPAYRVYFWRQQTLPDGAWESDEYRISGADILEVLAWASRKSRGQSFQVFVEHRDNRGVLGSIRLHGKDPVPYTESKFEVTLPPSG